MPRPACLRSPIWEPAESTALTMLYRAGWSWHAISAHVSGIYGNPRSYKACQSRGSYLGILESGRQGRQPLAVNLEDLEDLVILGYSIRRIAREMGVSASWVNTAIHVHISPQRRAAWQRAESQRRSQASRGRAAA